MGWRKEERPALGSGMQEAGGEARLWGQGKGPHCTAGRREAGFCSPTVCPGQGAPAEVLQTCLVSPFSISLPKRTAKLMWASSPSTFLHVSLCLSHLYPDHASQDLSLSPASSPVPASGSSQEHHPRE